MKKTGILCMILGTAAAGALFLLRRTDWYISEASRNLSETAEFIESAFWAALITVGIGLVLFLISLRKKPECVTQTETPAETPDDPEEDPFDFSGGFDEASDPDPFDASPDPDPFDTEPFHTPEPDTFGETRRFTEDDAMHSAQWVCDFCGTQNPDFSRFCAICGGRRSGD